MKDEYDKDASFNSKLLSANSIANKSSKRNMLLDNSSKLSISKLDDSNKLFLNPQNIFSSLNPQHSNSFYNNKLSINHFPILTKSQELEKNAMKHLSIKNQNEQPKIKTTFNISQSTSLKKLIEIEEGRTIRKLEKISDSDTEEEDSDNEIEQNWIILPENIYKNLFNLIVSIIIMYSSIFGVYKISFKNKASDFDKFFDIFSFIILTIDIILNFFSAYIDTEDNLVKNNKRIIRRYLLSWFTIDFISAFPFNLITHKEFNIYSTIARVIRLPKIYSLIHLFKLIRMVRLLKTKNTNKVTRFFLDIFKINVNVERLIYFIVAFLLLNHLAACIWYYVARVQEFEPECWVTRLGYIDSSDIEIYTISFYWTLTTVTTVGYGDINAGTNIERVYNLFLMSFGVIMYSFAIGSLSSIVSTLDDKTAEMNQKLQILSSIKKEFNLDVEIYDKVRKVIKYDLSRNQKDKMDFLQELPNKLRLELSQIMHDSVIQKIYFFKNQQNDFIAYVTPLLKSVKFSQNDYLYKCNDIIDEMYFIIKGTIILCLGKEYKEKELKEIKKYRNFGEIEMCLNEKLTHNIKVKSRNCELFVLKKNDFLRLSVNFKDYIESFLQKSLLKYLRFTEEKTKIINRMEEIERIENEIRGINKTEDFQVEEMEESYTDELISSDNSEKNQELIKLNNEDNKSIKEEKSSSSSSSSSSNSYSSSNIDSSNFDKDKKSSNSTIKELSESKKGKNYSSGEKTPKTFNDNNKSNPINKNKQIVKGDEKGNNSNIEQEGIFNMNENVDEIKEKLNTKFVEKVNKIIDFLEKNKITIGKEEDNFLNLLKQLIPNTNLTQRNEIIEKIEKIVNEYFKES